MKIGISGTRKGAHGRQYDDMCDMLKVLFSIEESNEFHHGDCIGVDKQAHDYVKTFHPEVVIIVHPPRDCKLRAYCEGHEIRRAADYLQRNHHIADECGDILIVPAQQHEVSRGSGTWATKRYAVKNGRRVHVIRPFLG